MRLLTHNMLRCNIRGIEDGYPLVIEAETVEEIPSEFDAEKVRVIVGKMNWSCLMSAVQNLKLPEAEVT